MAKHKKRLNKEIVFTAVGKNMLSYFQFLVKIFDVNAEEKDEEGWNLLHIASYLGNIAIAEFLLKHYPAMKDEKTNQGHTPFHLAAYCGEHIAMEYILDENKNVLDMQDNEGNAALHLAAYGGHQKAVEFLLKQKANAGIRNQKGNIPLDFAKERGYTEVKRILAASVVKEGKYTSQLEKEREGSSLSISKNDNSTLYR